MPEPTQRCSKCKAIKPLAEFHRNKEGRLGRRSMCKLCDRAYARRWNDQNRDRVRGVRHSWQSRNRDKMAEYETVYSRRNPLKRKVKSAVQGALRAGRLIRPSTREQCQKECVPHAHHQNYAKPLDVQWLCVSCHERLHRIGD